MTVKDSLVTMAELPTGVWGRVRLLRYPRPEVSTRLRELGISENVRMRCIIRSSGNVICEVQSMRIAFDESLARSILLSLDEEQAG